MSWYYYSDAREQKEKMVRELARMRKRGESLIAVEAPKGRHLAATFWGKAWCRHLESYADYETRLPRGRSYLRAGNVYDLAIREGTVSAKVAGSHLYNVQVEITPAGKKKWAALKKKCSGQVASLLDLLGGRLGDGVMSAVTDRDEGLFPSPREIRISCDCPDFADLCKHVASVLYAVAVKFDQDPRLFFSLRGLDPSEMIAASAAALTKPAVEGSDEISGSDLSALFGIELDEAGDTPEPLPTAPAVSRKSVSRKKGTAKKQSAATAKKKTSGAKKKPAPSKAKTKKRSPGK